MGFRIDPTQALKGMGEAQLKVMYAAEAYGRAAATKLEATAKQEASWHDRTALARQTIAGVCDWAGDALRIGIAGNMNYSPYLEFCNDERYAILWPTVNKMTAEILQGMAGLL